MDCDEQKFIVMDRIGKAVLQRDEVEVETHPLLARGDAVRDGPVIKVIAGLNWLPLCNAARVSPNVA